MDYLSIPGRNCAEWLPGNCLVEAVRDLDPESDKIIPAIEETLKEKGFDIPPFFVQICISIAAHEHGMTTLDPVTIQNIAHTVYNNPIVMQLLRDTEKQAYMQTIFEGRQTVADIIKASKQMD
ncbi:hypothetical protein JW752_05305 [Candidatus Peregrinibacteria bacterium]|nr:hypothetical protein [Candidatus Peregrinibacteria bacterium]